MQTTQDYRNTPVVEEALNQCEVTLNYVAARLRHATSSKRLSEAKVKELSVFLNDGENLYNEAKHFAHAGSDNTKAVTYAMEACVSFGVLLGFIKAL